MVIDDCMLNTAFNQLSSASIVSPSCITDLIASGGVCCRPNRRSSPLRGVVQVFNDYITILSVGKLGGPRCDPAVSRRRDACGGLCL